jgi:putative transposase
MPKIYRRGSHNMYDVKLHLVWITKYRYKVITKPIGKVIRQIIRRKCEELKVEIISGHLALDHVHLLISIPTTVAIAKIVKELKGYCSHEIQQQFPELKKKYWGQHFWSRGYFCVSSGNVTEEMIKKYIENHNSDDDFDDDNFKIGED